MFNFTKVSHQPYLQKLSKPDIENEAVNIIKESFVMQKDFCENPNKYLNQQYENLIKLTDFKFKNIDYQIYAYKEGDNYMSNFIIRTKGYLK